MSKVGALLRANTTLIRALQFAISALVLGIFSYYLANLTRHHHHIPAWEKAVEGMAGAAVIYTAFAVFLTCFLGGIAAFAFLAILLDLCFLGCFVAIAVLTKQGRRKCGRIYSSPIGNGQHASCRLQRVVFIVAIIAAALFLLSAIMQFLLTRNHKKEKKYGPSPANNYTEGSTKKQPFWKRNAKPTHDAELGTVGAAAVLAEEKPRQKRNGLRTSHDTGMTGSTAAPPDGTYGGTNTKYNQDHTVPAQNTGYIPPASSVPDTVVHDPNPYAEVHHGGYVHSHPESQQLSGSHGYTR